MNIELEEMNMGSNKQHIGLGVGFLILFGTSHFLVYDFEKLANNQLTSFYRFMPVLLTCGVIASLVWLIRLKGEAYGRVKFFWERPAALLVLLASTPFLLIAAILIKTESPGSALYRQERVGANKRRKDRRRKSGAQEDGLQFDRRGNDRRERDLGGKPFTLYKLRSMRANAEEETGEAWSTGDRDPRVTKVGYFVRRIHIDEMPQFYNVLRGQMNIIGPRPERPAFVRQLSKTIPGYCDRLLLVPGITGLAQVKQKYDESIEDVKKKVEHDRKYVEKACLLLDIDIALRTTVLLVRLFLNSLKRKQVKKAEPKTVHMVIPQNTTLELLDSPDKDSGLTELEAFGSGLDASVRTQ